MANNNSWKTTLPWILLQWVNFVIGQESPLSYVPTYGDQQPLIWGQEGISLDALVSDRYSKFSLKKELERRLSNKATISLAGDESFTILNARYSNYKRPEYIAVVQAAEENDVVETVNYARSRGIPFAARAGGHSLTTSLRRIKNAIGIDIRGLKSAVYDEKKQLMTVGGGITTGEFANATYARGMEVTVGSCPCTGVLGVSLGAGIGRLQGKYGYLNDNLVSARLLLANGTVIRVSAKFNSDLFWAIRGAGHNFGIVVEATYQIYPQLNDGKHLVVDFEYALHQTEDVLAALNSISNPMPKEPTININLVYSGPEVDAAPYTKLFDKISPIWKDTKIATWDALPWATYNGLNNILCTPQGWARFPIKNFYAANAKSYDIPTIRSYINSWRSMNEKYEGRAMFSFMFESFAQQKIQELPDDATAYPWRHGSQHFLMIEGAYKDTELEQEIDEWLSEQQDKLIEGSGYGRLQQYVNYGHGSKDAPEALYGYEPWRLERLRRLKKEYDPEGWFNGYQPLLVMSELEF
ncbi:hypothetical protein JX266_003304 [Neoarthrinium moseri]|nr:hypothetical protein JX266_003304 [Neoarthrinium moseri]